MRIRFVGGHSHNKFYDLVEPLRPVIYIPVATKQHVVDYVFDDSTDQVSTSCYKAEVYHFTTISTTKSLVFFEYHLNGSEAFISSGGTGGVYALPDCKFEMPVSIMGKFMHLMNKYRFRIREYR